MREWGIRILLSAAGAGLFQAGCLRAIQQEQELLWAPEANLGLVNSSMLVKLFGPGVLNFW